MIPRFFRPHRRLLISLAFVMALWAALVLAADGPTAHWQPDEDWQVAAEDYLSENLTPMPVGWRWETFTAADGAPLRWGQLDHPNQNATLLFVPGYGSTLEFYGELFGDLRDRGYSVIGLDMRGQGGSVRMLRDREKHWAGSFSVYTEELRGFIAARRVSEPGPLFLVGESFGAHVALRAEADDTLSVDGIVAVAPALKIRTDPISYGTAEFIVGTATRLGFGKSYTVGQSSWQPLTGDLEQPSLCGTYLPRLYLRDTLFTVRPEFRVGGPTNKWMYDVMASTRLFEREGLARQIEVPVLMAVADYDLVVDAPMSARLCREEFPDCALLMLPNTRHCVHRERPEIIDQVYDAVDEFVLRHGRRT